MKKSMIFFGCLALLAAGCNKIETVEAPVEEPVVESPDHLIVDITVGTESETRAVKTGWENGDKIYVFFDHFFLDYVSDPNIGTNGQGSPKYSYDVCYLTLTYNGSGWQSEFSQEGLETYLSGQSSGTIAAVYYGQMTPQFKCLHGIRGNKEEFYVELDNPGHFTGYYMFTEGDTYTVSDGRLMATLNMHMNERAVRFVIPGVPSSSRFGQGLECNNLVWIIPTGFSSVNLNGAGFQAPTVVTTTNGNVLRPAFEDSQMVFDGCLRTATYQGQEMEYTLQLRDKRTDSSLKDDLYYTLKKTATLNGLEVIKLPYLLDIRWEKSLQNPCDDRGFLNGYEWVLMGDGRKWAAKNYDYFDDYTDLHANCGAPGLYTYYNWADAEDYIRSNMGKGWRLPTNDEWNTLFASPNTKLTRVYDEETGAFRGDLVERWNVDGGYRVESNFFPANPVHFSTHNDMGYPNGYYWTATTDPNDETMADAFILYANDSAYIGRISLYKGFMMEIRAIIDE